MILLSEFLRMYARRKAFRLQGVTEKVVNN